MSPETRAKISASLMGHPISDETRAKWRSQRAGAKRKPPSPETRAKIGAAQKGRPNRGRQHPNSIAALRAHRRTGSTWTPEQRIKMSAMLIGNRLILDAPVKGECVYCFGPATTHDHVIPKGRPGWDDPDNLVLACRWCNSAKNARTPEEWFATN